MIAGASAFGNGVGGFSSPPQGEGVLDAGLDTKRRVESVCMVPLCAVCYISLNPAWRLQ
jgi:ferredoxin